MTACETHFARFEWLGPLLQCRMGSLLSPLASENCPRRYAAGASMPPGRQANFVRPPPRRHAPFFGTRRIFSERVLRAPKNGFFPRSFEHPATLQFGPVCAPQRIGRLRFFFLACWEYYNGPLGSRPAGAADGPSLVAAFWSVTVSVDVAAVRFCDEMCCFFLFATEAVCCVPGDKTTRDAGRL